jgi:hypothetical protein
MYELEALDHKHHIAHEQHVSREEERRKKEEEERLRGGKESST